MALLDETRLEKHATAIVDRFFGEKTALTEGVADVAEQDNFNPEQVKRLVEAVNNMTFLRKFEGADDRIAASEFQPADANAALSAMLDNAQTLHDAPRPSEDPPEASDLGDALPVTRPEVPRANPLEKEAFAQAKEPHINPDIVTMRLRKTAGLFRDEEYQARVKLTDTFQKVASSFARTDTAPFVEFEKAAFYKWGARAAPFLNILRDSLRLPPAEYDHAEMRKVARVIDSSTSTMRHFHEMMVYSEEAHKAEKGLRRVEEHLHHLEG